MKPSRPNYAMISLLQFIGAILVILLHCRRVFEDEGLHFIQKSIFGRMVVPYFMVTSAFFIRKQLLEDRLGFRTYIKRLITTYLIWSMVYLPFAIYYFLNEGYPIALLPAGLGVGLLYTGMSYQLWYIPAFLMGLFLVSFFWKCLGPFWTTSLAFIFFIIGSIETYSALLESTLIGEWFEYYQTYFLTTRNGLFYAPIFISLGFIAYDYRNVFRLTGYFYLTWLVITFLYLMETYLIFHHQGHDKNFFIGLVPWTVCLFIWSLQTSWFKDKEWFHLKKWSSFYYFSHVLFVELGFFGFSLVISNAYLVNRLTFVSSLFLLHLCCLFLPKKYLNSK